ncbi:hypothetical protein ACXX9E_29795 [Pseudomonas sp. GNP014]
MIFAILLRPNCSGFTGVPLAPLVAAVIMALGAPCGTTAGF